MSEEEFTAAVDEVLEAYYRGQITPYEALNRISQLKGANDVWRLGRPKTEGQQQ